MNKTLQGIAKMSLCFFEVPESLWRYKSRSVIFFLQKQMVENRRRLCDSENQAVEFPYPDTAIIKSYLELWQ